MLIKNIEDRLNDLIKDINKDTFIFDLITAYGQPKATITRLQKGDYNLSNNPNLVIWKRKLYFQKITDQDPHVIIDKISKDKEILKNSPRFIIVTNFNLFLAIDTKTKQTLDINLNEISNHVDFFLPWSGLEKSTVEIENPADIKAAEKLGILYDLIIQENEKNIKDTINLNIFFSRLMFCFFAEDSGIFLKSQFTNSIKSYTIEDGSDLKIYLTKLFKRFNDKETNEYPKYLKDFPYVNGDLFLNNISIPNFNRKIRKIIIECGNLDWVSINPDILGSMMQAIVHKSERESLGMHYTSIVNIMKVISPLFLDDLYKDLERWKNNEKGLEKILQKIYKINIFDPACGSGNFLIIAYKELCKIEIKIYLELQQLNPSKWNLSTSGIRLKQFYGIEIDNFAQETAKISLLISQHQMNLQFEEVFGKIQPTLPLSYSGNIICGNATLLDWNNVCPIRNDEVNYLIGNPPYVGSSMQSKSQKSDLENIFKKIGPYKNLDYIACWFLLGAKYISRNNSQFSFVSTNSITQGEQVSLLWPHIFKLGLEINFAYSSFKWSNNARGNAGVSCVIIGINKESKKTKTLFKDNLAISAKKISPYLIISNSNVIISRTSKQINGHLEMVQGNQARDDGNFIMTTEEKEKLISENHNSKKFIKKYIGSQEFINGSSRWCLWIKDNEKTDAENIPQIKERIKKVKNFRLKSKASSTRGYALKSYKFAQIQHQPSNVLLIPRVSSENRIYIPIGFFNSDCVLSDSANGIYNPKLYIFSILSSKMHMAWIKTVGGRLENRFRYSTLICYNAFPFPKIGQDEILSLDKKAFSILDEREKYPDKTIGQLYNPDKMPYGLLLAHKELDEFVDKIYRPKPFNSDDERLEHLFDLYEKKMNKNSLF